MNIRSQELLMLNKSMKKFNQNPLPPQTEETGVENPINKSSLIMNAMDIQGKNNIAFQGVMTKLANKTVAKTLAGAVALTAASSTLTSCRPDQINIENTTNISVNFDAFTALMEENNELLRRILAQNGANGETLNQILSSINSIDVTLYSLYENGTLTLEQIQKLRQDLCRYYLTIHNDLQNGNEINEEIRDYIRDLLLSYGLQGEELEEIFNQILDSLSNINNNLEGINEALNSIDGTLQNLYANGTLTLEQIQALREDLENYYNGIWQQLEEGQGVNEDIREYIRQLLESYGLQGQELQNLLNQIIDSLNNINSNLEEINEALNSIDGTLQNLYANGTLTLEEIQALREDLENYYNGIWQQLEEGQANDEEIKNYIRQLLISYGLQGQQLEELLNQILDSLDIINNTLNQIYAEIQKISKNMSLYHFQYLQYQNASLTLLTKLYHQGLIDQNMLGQLINGVGQANENLELLNKNIVDLKNIITDPEAYQQFMNDLAGLMPEDIDYQQFKDMFEMLGLTMQDIANLSREQILAAIENFQNTYVETEQQEQQILNDISQKLNVLQKLEHLNIPELTELLKNLEIAINNNSENIIDELQAIQGQLNTIMEKLDAIFSNLDKLVYFADEQSKNWDSALQLLGTNNALLQNIKANQAVTNEELAKLNENQQILINKQETSNSYLYLLNQKADEIKQLIKEFDPQGGMTVEEFKNALRELYPELVADFEQFIKDYGFDDIPDHLLTLIQLAENIDTKLANQTDYSDKLDRLITIQEAMWAFIQNMDFSDPEQLAKLDIIIERLDQILEKLDCLCDEEDESVEDILNDLENMFPGVKRITSNGNRVNMDQVKKLKAQLEVARNSVVTGYNKKHNAVKVNGFKY